MADLHPICINDYEVYYDGKRLVGIVDAELPNIQMMSQEMKGAGNAGTIDVPILGHIQAMTCKLTWRTATENIKLLMGQEHHKVELWAANQGMEGSSFIIQQQKIILDLMPKSINLGKFATGDVQGMETEFSVWYLKWMVGSSVLCEIDPVNGKYVVGDKNFLEDMLSAVGRV